MSDKQPITIQPAQQRLVPCLDCVHAATITPAVPMRTQDGTLIEKQTICTKVSFPVPIQHPLEPSHLLPAVNTCTAHAPKPQGEA